MFACPPVERLDALLGEQLSNAQRDALEDHLSSCSRCQQTLIDRSGDAEQWHRLEPLLHTKQPADSTPTELLSGLRASCLGIPSRPRGTDPGPVPTIPGYEIIGELGRGGMAVVYRARQLGLNRLVALKMILAGRHAAPELRDRFRREAEAVARLQHPNVVQVYEIGEHDGLPYFSMELVEGGSLKASIGERTHSPSAAAALIETLGRAIHAAHLAGVVHRDLKPANILLQVEGPQVESRQVKSLGVSASDFPTFRRDDLTTPKVTDFGLALHQDAGEGWTRTGDILGTPQYMAPEQAQGRRSDVGPATDIHALGVILYEMLTGRVPFTAEDEVSTLVQVSFEEPVSPRRLRSSVPRDLETICLKCLRKLPRHRYATALELAEDLRRFQAGEPILARPISTRERLVKWARRRPFTAAMLLGTVLFAALSFTGITWAMLDARTARNDESIQRKKAEDAGSKALEALDRSERSVYLSTIAQARSQWLLNNVPGTRRLLDRCRPERREWEWHYLRGLNHGDLLTIPDTTAPWVMGLAFSPDGRWLASCGGDPYSWPNSGILQVYDPTTGQLRWRKAGLPHLVRGLAFSPDGRFIASAGGNWREAGGGKLRLWNAETGDIVRDFPAHDDEPVYRVAFSPDGRRLASASLTRETRVWDSSNGKELYRASKAQAETVAFTPNGKFLVHDGAQGIEFREADSGKLVAAYPRVKGFFALSPDGTCLATLHRDQLRVWDITRVGTEQDNAELPLVQAFNGHEGNIVDLAFRPDGQAIATAGADGTVRLWELSLDAEPTIFRGHEGRVGAVAFHPDGCVLASGGRPPGDVKVWDVTRKTESVEAVSFSRERFEVSAIGFSGGDRELLVLGSGGVLRRWECNTGMTQERELRHTTGWLVPATLAAFSDDGKLVVSVADDIRVVRVLQTDSGREVAVLRGHTVRVRFVACDRECQRIVTAGTGTRDNRTLREVKVWDGRTGALVHQESAFDEQCDGIAISPDGTRFLEAHRVLEAAPTGGMRPAPDGAILTLCSLDGVSAQRLPAPGTGIAALAFSPKGSYLAAAGNDGTIRLWNREGNPLHESPLPGPERLSGLAFNPDETRLAGLNRERVQIWDVASGQDVLFLRTAAPRAADNGFNPRVVWSHDGTKLAASNWDRSVIVWDSADASGESGKTVLASQTTNRGFNWHLARADAYSKPETLFAAAFHRSRVLTQKVLTPAQRRQRGDFLARSARWDEAKTDYAALFTGELPESPDTCREYATLLAKTNDWATYRKLRTAALAKWGDDRDSTILGPVIRLAGWLPTSEAETAQLLQMAQRCQDGPGAQATPPALLAFAQCRFGDWETANRALMQESELPRDEPRPELWLRQALLLLRSGRTAEADVWLKHVDAWLAEQEKLFPPARVVAPTYWTWGIDLEIRMLRKEVGSRRTTSTPKE